MWEVRVPNFENCQKPEKLLAIAEKNYDNIAELLKKDWLAPLEIVENRATILEQLNWSSLLCGLYYQTKSKITPEHHLLVYIRATLTPIHLGIELWVELLLMQNNGIDVLFLTSKRNRPTFAQSNSLWKLRLNIRYWTCHPLTFARLQK